MAFDFTPSNYRATPLDFSALANLPNDYFQSKDAARQRNIQSARDKILSGGVTDIPSMAKQLLAAGDIPGALSLANIDKAFNTGAMSPYEQQSLAMRQKSLDIQQQGYDQARIPQGYTKDPSNPGQLVPIPGGPAGKIPENVAGAIGMMDTGQKELDSPVRAPENPTDKVPTARELLTDPSKWSTSQSIQAISPGVGSLFTKGDVVNAQSAVRVNVEAALRMMTGAAAPQEEVDRYAAMFTPGWKDSKNTATAKLRRLDEFTQRATALATQGRTAGDAPSADPRGALLPDAGSPQGMNRNVAPEGTIISNGQQTLIKKNGQWIPQ